MCTTVLCMLFLMVQRQGRNLGFSQLMCARPRNSSVQGRSLATTQWFSAKIAEMNARVATPENGPFLFAV